MAAVPSDLRGLLVAVVGMARSGRAAAALALSEGARLRCHDRRPDAEVPGGCEARLGPHREDDFLDVDLLVLSPGVPASLPAVQAAVAAGVPVVGELGLAASRLRLPWVAVTGTNGKSTTTHFAGQLLEGAGYRTFVGGNLGRPLSEAVLAPGGHYERAVVEVSSYQLEFPGELHPRGACILNLAPDHLGRHGSLEAYAEAKCRLFDRLGPGEPAVLPAGNELLARLAEGRGGERLWLGAHPGVRLEGEEAVLRWRGAEERYSLAELRVPGRHNRENAAAALLLARALGARPGELDPSRLTALEHRMQVVAEGGGVSWIDDSKATNVHAARAGLGGLEQPFVALLGGLGKDGDDYAELRSVLGRARAVLCFGRSGPRIARALDGLPVELFASMEEAVRRAAVLARPGDAVVLSPACASFDAYRDFAQRGEVFTELARRLAGRGTP